LTTYAQVADDADPLRLANALTEAGLQVERIEDPSRNIDGPVVVGQVLDFVAEPQKNGKTIRWCQVDVGQSNPPGQPSRGIVCGADNFAVGDFVPVVLPGTVLPGGFQIAARKTYGHVSDGMICAEDELGLGTDHAGIIVFAPGEGVHPGADALELLGAKDPVYEIDVTPDEGYCLSVRGLAREAAQITGSVFTDPYSTPLPEPVDQGYPVVLESPDCQVFVAISVSGLNPDAVSPAWMVRRLKAVGIRSISLAVDVTNYVMVESGQPLHAYDAARLNGPIRVRKARASEHLVTLDHVDRALSPDDLLITDDSGPIGLAGVMGGLTTELTDDTTQILLEAAWFSPASVGRTYRRHHLPSEASRRFERAVDTSVAFAAARRAAELLRDLGSATILDAITVVGQPQPMPSLTLNDVQVPSRILGIELSDDTIAQTLRASGIQVDVASDGAWTLTPPTWRPDLVHAYDYVEEVGRKIGLSAIQPRVPTAPAGAGYTREQRARRAVIEAVAQAGFVEVIPLPFMAGADLDRMGLPGDDPRRAVVRIANPLSEAQPYLRTSLLPGLLAAINRNTSRSLTDLALFECGSVFRAGEPGALIMPDVRHRPGPDDIERLFSSLPIQPRHLAVVLTGDWRAASPLANAEPATWVHAVYAALTAAAALGVTLVRRPAQVMPWHPGRCADLGVVRDGQFVSVGWAGELHPQVVEDWTLPKRACAMELDLDALIELAPPTGQIRELSAHPATKQDVAVVVDTTVSAADLQAALVAGAGPLLESITLFDIFTGDQIGTTKKSMAYALVFRATDRTLTEAEASQARDQAVAEAARRCGAVLRA
jgi:phenylalanyl-tRNA synthetase beta chain